MCRYELAELGISDYGCKSNPTVVLIRCTSACQVLLCKLYKLKVESGVRMVSRSSYQLPYRYKLDIIGQSVCYISV